MQSVQSQFIVVVRSFSLSLPTSNPYFGFRGGIGEWQYSLLQYSCYMINHARESWVWEWDNIHRIFMLLSLHFLTWTRTNPHFLTCCSIHLLTYVALSYNYPAPMSHASPWGYSYVFGTVPSLVTSRHERSLYHVEKILRLSCQQR